MRITTNNEKETFAFAKKFAKTLKGGEIIGLIGDLGAGKTVFTKGLASGLGIKNTVNSPTFVLMKVYKAQGKIKNLVHIDAYRLQSMADLTAIGAEEYFNRADSITVIEWVDKIQSDLPSNNLIMFNFTRQNKEKRTLSFTTQDKTRFKEASLRFSKKNK